MANALKSGGWMGCPIADQLEELRVKYRLKSKANALHNGVVICLFIKCYNNYL